MTTVLLLGVEAGRNPAKRGLTATLLPSLAVSHPNQILKESTSRLCTTWRAAAGYYEMECCSLHGPGTPGMLPSPRIKAPRNSSDNGGQTAAILTSLTTTCRRLGVDPFEYLRDVFQRISTHPQSNLDDLLPNRWQVTRSTTAA